MDFMTIPPGPFRLTDVSVPACLLGKRGDLVRVSLSVSDGSVVQSGGAEIDMRGKMVLPCFVDMHTHLDKGHIAPRTPNPNGTFQGALQATATDRQTHWSAEDVRARMEFAMQCAYAHGTRSIRTHLDSGPPQEDITWPVFQELRTDWADRIDLQAVCLESPPSLAEGGTYQRTAQLTHAAQGVLGLVTYPHPDLKTLLVKLFETAGHLGMDVDLHVDETLDAGTNTLRIIANVVREIGYQGRATVGHCCALSMYPDAAAFETLDQVAKAGLHVVSLPMCNLYLQDRQANRTPRMRGITLVHEMRARDIPVSFASDNTRDPFYAYGDLDMVEVLREATRIGHLDHSAPDWIHSVTATPARTCGFATPSFDIGAPADFILFNARNWGELFARPQADRVVLRNGQQIDRTLPDYAELDSCLDPK